MVDILCAFELCCRVIWSWLQQINIWTTQAVRSLLCYVLLNVFSVSNDHSFYRAILEQSESSVSWYTMFSWTFLLFYLIMIVTDQYLNNPSTQSVDILCAFERCYYVKWWLVQQRNTWTIQHVRWLIYYVLLNSFAVFFDHDCSRSIFEQCKRSDRWYIMCSWRLLLCYLIISATDQYVNNPSSQIVDILCCVECCLDADFVGIWEVE
jgi:hypothetical protein